MSGAGSGPRTAQKAAGAGRAAYIRCQFGIADLVAAVTAVTAVTMAIMAASVGGAQ